MWIFGSFPQLQYTNTTSCNYLFNITRYSFFFVLIIIIRAYTYRTQLTRQEKKYNDIKHLKKLRVLFSKKQFNLSSFIAPGNTCYFIIIFIYANVKGVTISYAIRKINKFQLVNRIVFQQVENERLVWIRLAFKMFVKVKFQ